MKIKKLLSIFLAVVMMLGACPVMNVFAAEERSVIDSGICGAQGDNLTWTLYDDGELVISGEGEMDWYYISAPVFKYAPWWKAHYNKVRVITIEEGVTSIGADVFLRSGTSFNRINLPMSLEFIEGNVFGETNLPTGAHLAICYPGDAAAWEKVQMKTINFITNEETGKKERVITGSVTPVMTASSPVYRNAKLYLNGEKPEPFCEITGDEDLNVVTSDMTVRFKANYYFGDLENAKLQWKYEGDSGNFIPNTNLVGVNDSATLSDFNFGEGVVKLSIVSEDGKVIASDKTNTFVSDHEPEKEYSPIEKFFGAIGGFFFEIFLLFSYGFIFLVSILSIPFQPLM